MAEQVLVEEASRRLAAAAAPGTRVILFGSHARGDAGRQSDLDFSDRGFEVPAELAALMISL
jgi:predicted nucleotidyltransferase